MIDLVIITPDGAYPVVLSAMLNRPHALNIGQISREIIKDALHDSSGNAVDLLRPYLGKSRKALVIRDLEGSGWEDRGSAVFATELLKSAIENGWNEESCAVIVVEPEIEVWLRMPSPHLESMVHEKARRNRDLSSDQIHSALEEIIDKTGGRTADGKPVRPKESFELFLRLFGIPRSNALYQYLAERESLARCVSRSFNHLTEILHNWFPVQTRGLGTDVDSEIAAVEERR
jgi:hypothetical protein